MWIAPLDLPQVSFLLDRCGISSDPPPVVATGSLSSPLDVSVTPFWLVPTPRIFVVICLEPCQPSESVGGTEQRRRNVYRSKGEIKREDDMGAVGQGIKIPTVSTFDQAPLPSLSFRNCTLHRSKVERLCSARAYTHKIQTGGFWQVACWQGILRRLEMGLIATTPGISTRPQHPRLSTRSILRDTFGE